MEVYGQLFGAGGGNRTHTPVKVADFKSAASTVPPPRPPRRRRWLTLNIAPAATGLSILAYGHQDPPGNHPSARGVRKREARQQPGLSSRYLASAITRRTLLATATVFGGKVNGTLA